MSIPRIGRNNMRYGVYRLCDLCKTRMRGILRQSDENAFEAPRKLCIDCEAPEHRKED